MVLPDSPLGLPTLNTMKVDPKKIRKDLLTAEISRICVASDHRGFRKTIRILQMMQKELCRVSSETGIEQLIGAVEPAFLHLLHRSALPYRPFGPLQYRIGAERYPVVFRIGECGTAEKGRP
jgi:N-acyl-L-homoserine lactone synthetase